MKTKMNHLTILLFAILVFSANLTIAQIRGNGNVVSENRTTGPFTSVTVDNSTDIYITEGNSNTVTVKADENLLPIIKTEVTDGVLYVSTSKSFSRAKALEVHITMSKIDKLTSSGSGDIYCDGVSGSEVSVRLNGSGDFKADFTVKNLELKLNGSGDAEVSGVRGQLRINISGSGDVEAEDLQLESCYMKLMGSGDIELEGSTVKLTIKQSGSGDVNAYNLKAVEVIVSNTGSGDLVVHAIEKLDVSLNGSGDVTYTGSPVVNIDSHGSGEVYRK